MRSKTRDLINKSINFINFINFIKDSDYCTGEDKRNLYIHGDDVIKYVIKCKMSKSGYYTKKFIFSNFDIIASNKLEHDYLLALLCDKYQGKLKIISSTETEDILQLGKNFLYEYTEINVHNMNIKIKYVCCDDLPFPYATSVFTTELLCLKIDFKSKDMFSISWNPNLDNIIQPITKKFMWKLLKVEVIAKVITPIFYNECIQNIEYIHMTRIRPLCLQNTVYDLPFHQTLNIVCDNFYLKYYETYFMYFEKFGLSMISYAMYENYIKHSHLCFFFNEDNEGIKYINMYNKNQSVQDIESRDILSFTSRSYLDIQIQDINPEYKKHIELSANTPKTITEQFIFECRSCHEKYDPKNVFCYRHKCDCDVWFFCPFCFKDLCCPEKSFRIISGKTITNICYVCNVSMHLS